MTYEIDAPRAQDDPLRAGEAAALPAQRTSCADAPAGPAAAPGPSGRLGPVLAAVVPAAVTLAFGLWRIRHRGSMWQDESTTYQVAHRSISEIWRLLGDADAVHGLYYLFMHVWFAVWGGGVLALRMPSALGMAAAAAGIGLIGHRLAGPWTGLAAGCAFPMISSVQYYAQEGRSYALVSAAVVWSTYLLLRAVDRRTWTAWAGYGAAAALSCLLHEFAVLSLLAHGVTLLLARVPRGVWWGWICSAGAACAVLAPLVVTSQRQSGLVGWIPDPTRGQWEDLFVLILTGAVCGLVPVPARGRIRVRTVALPLLALPPVALLTASYAHPLYLERYTLYMYAGLALLFGAALEWMLRTAWDRRLVALGLIAVVFLLHLSEWRHMRTPASRRDNTLATAQAVRDLARPGDGVVFTPHWRREAMLSSPEKFQGLRDVTLQEAPGPSGTLAGVEVPPARMRPAMLAGKRLILVGDLPWRRKPGNPQEDAKRKVLREDFRPCVSRRVQTIVVVVYVPRHGGRC
ncbi:glycosyltransferase family 39 protein [Streptomyces sp. B1866]|uniref:glycosyltransferase family 39 protein n=1 Tax=Streptomyces sp. B1866 TaxID=3075431 RepID=UPI0028923EB2|nr:glycosyltransferase family 39 protein [Streptomyces sp. B1866]MDT3400545.1 glycosyltransferase family 39 protein [Streptomyces sp. B1866]